MNKVAHFHLPGLFEFYELYRIYLRLYKEHKEYFYDWCDIGSIYGSPVDCLWAGGRVENGDASTDDVLSLLKEHGISPRLTLSNSLLREEHLSDRKCNLLCKLFEAQGNSGAIVYSDLLIEYLRKTYPDIYLVSSTTKVITEFPQFLNELNKEEFSYIVPDFRLNKSFDQFNSLPQRQKDKVEFLINECCWAGCKDRADCYRSVSKLNLGIEDGHKCKAPESRQGYRFSKAMENPMFISVEDIKNTYLPMGFTNFKIEGRGLGSALVLEMLIYYMTKPEYQINVREEIYLDNSLDLF